MFWLWFYSNIYLCVPQAWDFSGPTIIFEDWILDNHVRGFWDSWCRYNREGR